MDNKKQQLMAIVGSDNVLDDPATLERYSRDESFVPPLRPWFVVRPKDADEVQALVKWANDTQTPVIPVSSGPPHFNGDTVPSVAEGVVVDLSRMKAIQRIDRRNKIVIIEPGVTYSELGPALAKEGLRISRPLMPRPNKSVVASLLEREPTLIPRLNFSLPEPLRTCGVVWGSGELSYTGEAAMGPPSLEAQWKMGLAQVSPTGPMSTDFMRLLTGAQGTMGIVVWASVKCELLPSVHKYVFIPGEKLEDLIDFCCRLERLRLGDEVLVLNNAQLATMLGSRAGDVSQLRQDLPSWVVVVGLAGAALYPQERVEVQEKDTIRLAQECGLQVLNGVSTVVNADIVSTLGATSAEPHWKLHYKGGSQGIFFLTTLDKTPQFIRTVCAVAEGFHYPASEIGIYIQPQHHGVSQHLEFNLPFDPTDKKEEARVKQIYVKASEELVAQGAYFSRPYGLWADLMYSRDATSTTILRKVKQILDPKNVLNPGKLCF